MEILLNKVTTDADLKKGLQVCYQDQSGEFTKLGKITDIIPAAPEKGRPSPEYILNTSFGSYTADELKLIKPETFYIYKAPFNGIIESTMQNGLVDYTGDERSTRTVKENGAVEIQIYFENKLTLSEYIKQKGYNPEEIKTATSAEMDQLFKEHEENERTDWKEITEERAEEMLNVLPPARFTKLEKGYFFFVSEAYSGDNHSCFAYFRGRYFESLRSIKEPTESIYKSLRETAPEVAAS